MTTQATHAQDSARVTNAGWILAGTILPSSMAFISGNALIIALPALQAELGARASDVLWIVNGYMLLLSALIMIGGALGDRFGRKRVFMLGILVFTLTSALSAFMNNVNLLIGLRMVQGIGAALMVPGSLAILSAAFPPTQRGRAIGTWSTFSAITTVFGTPLGGILADAGLWRAVFFINVPLGIAALYILWRYVPESRDETTSARLDYLGALLIALALGGVTYAFTEAPNIGWGAPLILITVFGGLLAFILFIIVELRSDQPLVPLKLFRDRTFTGTNLMTFFVYATLGVFPVFLALNLIQVQGYSESAAGFSILPFGILLALMSRWAGGLIDRVGARLPLTLGPLVLCGGYVLLALNGMTGGAEEYFTTFFPAVVCLGIGIGITVAPLTTAVMNAVPNEAIGTASGINNAVSRVAGVLALAICGALMLTIFAEALRSNTADLPLSAEARLTLAANAAQLAEAQPPDDLDSATKDAVRAAIKAAFVAGFQVLMLVLAGLCALGALTSFVSITPHRR
ncbi:MAG: DHA2 family efflux MFS transporter permease subunit [Chloroflexi bacterium CFX4]|nr:DHA2 family efflux MFS transporter permease subunit [Chloroflexi bacterium CFX4]MDL1923850.1 MFS transporter [Chloroflexi bacterium CFX3]